MSELKAYYVPTRSGNSCHCYIKDEADKVIVEQTTLRALAEMQLRHNKYKRCLAMADYSMYHHFRMLEIYGKRLDNDRAVFKINFGLKWLYRWLKLAEQFKEAK